MKNAEKYKKLIQSIKNTDQFTQEEIDADTKSIIIRQFTNMSVDDKFEILQDAVRAETSRRKEDIDTGRSVKTESVEDFNKKELIKLKMFFLRGVVMAVLVTVGLFILTYILLGTTVVHTGNALVNEAIAIFGYLFN